MLKQNIWRRVAVGTLLTALLAGCQNLTTLLQGLSIEKPAVRIEAARITGLGFDHISLSFRVGIDNPNAVSLTLAGFDYRLLVNDRPFIDGEQKEKIIVRAGQKSGFDFPLTVQFSELSDLVGSLAETDSSAYEIRLGLLFDLPVLGNTRIPVKHAGQFPLVQLPKISVSGLRLEGINLTGASLVLDVRIDNPNSFSMRFENLNYRLQINDVEWATGIDSGMQRIAANRENILHIPINLNLIKMGAQVVSLLKSNQNLRYNLSGSTDMQGDHPLFGTAMVPFTLSGTLDLTR